jgi:hypothetical protein
MVPQSSNKLRCEPTLTLSVAERHPLISKRSDPAMFNLGGWHAAILRPESYLRSDYHFVRSINAIAFWSSSRSDLKRSCLKRRAREHTRHADTILTEILDGIVSALTCSSTRRVTFARLSIVHSIERRVANIEKNVVRLGVATISAPLARSD